MKEISGKWQAMYRGFRPHARMGFFPAITFEPGRYTWNFLHDNTLSETTDLMHTKFDTNMMLRRTC